jgi:DNA-binding PadR family transcriptional regulator
MSTIDLIVLGILLSKARNAYDLVRFIRDSRIDRVLKISEPAVFKSCRRLAAAGYLDGETVRSEGVPDKVVYAVNASGKQRFTELMTHFAQEVKPFYLDFNSVMWNIDQLQKPQALQLLTTIREQLHAIHHWVTEHEKEVRDHLPFGARQIVRQYCMTVGALAQWSDQALEEFKQET